MVLVTYFTESVTSGTRSLLSNRGVIGKMAMPREMFPVASMLVSLWHAIPQLIILRHRLPGHRLGRATVRPGCRTRPGWPRRCSASSS